ncbi:3681_t:CDS:10 [Paraglomus brasilianum]|uniref:3681_t:CDS:1 n=1 Tax=Paraglomus brasilianum TaxID=144538 RepID=A0A9N8ZDF6_9GLOM|nr:3681_t:CDS:10 [Paraglomus brasilianum]
MTKVIGTHDGQFHCDEALAVFMLKRTAAFKESNVIRTRDSEQLAKCDVIVDVGGVYNPSTMRFDHHQRGFFETFNDKRTIKLSSAGLIYKHFGKEIIATQLGLEVADSKVAILYDKIYEDFIEALDAVDNGINQYPSEIPAKYKETTTLPSRVATFNPWWNRTDVDVNKQFIKASEMAGSEFIDKIEYLGKAWLPAREIVIKSFEKRFEYDKLGRIMILSQHCPWKEHLFNIEEETKVTFDTRPLYIIYHSSNSWRVQAVPAALNLFDSRKPLPEAWRGLRDAELSERAGVKDCTFVHMSGFTGGNATLEGVLEMAKKALEIE